MNETEFLQKIKDLNYKKWGRCPDSYGIMYFNSTTVSFTFIKDWAEVVMNSHCKRSRYLFAKDMSIKLSNIVDIYIKKPEDDSRDNLYIILNKEERDSLTGYPTKIHHRRLYEC
jgi:hypothetical protein